MASGPKADQKPEKIPADRPAAAPSLRGLLSVERTRAQVVASSRKRALEHGCEVLAGSNNFNARTVLDALLARERLGSTALGDGVAIPHCRLADCTSPLGVLLTLKEGVDYNAPDEADVDLLFILIVPESAVDEHLQILSSLASVLIDDDNRYALRKVRDNLTLFETWSTFSGQPGISGGAATSQKVDEDPDS